MNPPMVFALARSAALGDEIAARLGAPRSPHEERDFEDGEHKCRPLVSVRGRDVYVVDSLYGEEGASAPEKLVRLLLFLGAVRDADARSVTALVPYLCFSRKDRRTKPRDPVSTRYVARLFEAMDVDRVVTVDVHNDAAFENAFRCRIENLEARPLLVEHVAGRVGDRPVTVVSPDIGGVKRAERFARTLERRLGRDVLVAFLDKKRSDDVVGGTGEIAGDVRGRAAVLVDDLVATGTTLARAAAACRARGATAVVAAATHGVFTSAAAATLGPSPIDELVVTDTVRGRAPPPRVTALPIAPLLAEVVRRLHEGGSLVELGLVELGEP